MNDFRPSRGQGRKKLAWAVGLALVLTAGSAAFLSYLRTRRSNAVMRGWVLAQENGCFSCHGWMGSGGVPNVGSETGEVPAWDGGMLLMHVENTQEIAEWIRFGGPKRLRGNSDSGEGEEHEEHAEHEKEEPTEAGHRHEHESHGLLSMPAFGNRLSDAEISDLAALVRVIGAYRLAPRPAEAQKGHDTAKKFGCFGCHRLGGLIGPANPGSLKGYIPPWLGQDFEELVRDDMELREWVNDGSTGRLRGNPFARFFTNRQKVQMPAFRSVLKDGDLEALAAYIQWLRETGGGTGGASRTD